MDLQKTVSEPFIDLRMIYNNAANGLSIVGFLLNAFLIFLIFFKTPKKISDYKIILIQNCLVDVLYNCVNDIVKGQADYKSGTFYMLGSDLFKGELNKYYVFAINSWVFALFYCVTSIPVQFVFRYFIICRGRTLSLFQYLILLSISTIAASSFAAFHCFVTWPKSELFESKVLLLENDVFYFRGIPPFVVAEIQHWPLRFLFAYGYFLVTLSILITVFTCWKVWKKIKSQAGNFSAETKKLHDQMTKTMILQAIIPVIFVLGPVGIAITGTFALFNIPGFGLINNSVTIWIPVANPLVTIISVKTFRRIVISYFQRCLCCGRQKFLSISPSTIAAVTSNQ